MKKYDCLKLENQLCYPIYLCSKELIKKYSPILDSLDLTYTQYIVMMYFWDRDECNVKTLSECLLIDSSTLTPLLKKLENKGYIQRQRNKEDERNLILRITDKGKSLKQRAVNVPCKMEKCLDLSEDEIKSLYSLSYKIINNLKKENDKK